MMHCFVLLTNSQQNGSSSHNKEKTLCISEVEKLFELDPLPEISFG